MNAVIRVATPADAVSACSMLCRSISECCKEDHRNDAQILSAWLGNKTPENVAAWFACSSHYAIVASSEDEVAGVAIMTRQGRILLFYVLPELRFTGMGKALLHSLEAQAKEWGVRAMHVSSTQSAKNFYSRNGFVPAGLTQSAFGIETVCMSKALTGVKPCGCGKS